jgi:hypothetical protein
VTTVLAELFAKHYKKEIHSLREGAKKGGHTEKKRLHKKSKA